jgi:type VI protein secretion system component VasA
MCLVPVKINAMDLKPIIFIFLDDYFTIRTSFNFLGAKNLYFVPSSLHLFSKVIGIYFGSRKKTRQESMEDIDDFH